ncbi:MULTISPECIES: hypothetical protein [Pectobacterium]|uniref:DUF551 domain-containing protein n=1 Tax=Pectobacterium zantedeschiae TaxID=2034769 RepID=A0A9X8P3C1_9GAMM|nr:MULTISPECIES: hypothetical protein [Pectobacterium]MBA5238348.1 hypothetical protein [Pectobacterium aroidearum]RYC38905.1 hypothetical protein CLR69_21885 [Pectobacterium zantedeschiae]
MLTNEKLQQIKELAQKANYKPDDRLLAVCLAAACDSEIIEEMAKEILSLRAVIIPPSSNSLVWIGIDWAKGYNLHDLKPIMRDDTPEEFKRLFECRWLPESKGE